MKRRAPRRSGMGVVFGLATVWVTCWIACTGTDGNGDNTTGGNESNVPLSLSPHPLRLETLPLRKFARGEVGAGPERLVKSVLDRLS
jgi:hypothetical protein